MIHGFLLAIGALRAVFLSQADLVLENLALGSSWPCLPATVSVPASLPPTDCSGSPCGDIGCDGPTCSSSSNPRQWSAGTKPVFVAMGPGSRGAAAEVDHQSRPACAP